MEISNRVKAAATALPPPTRVMSMGSVQSPHAAGARSPETAETSLCQEAR